VVVGSKLEEINQHAREKTRMYSESQFICTDSQQRRSESWLKKQENQPQSYRDIYKFMSLARNYYRLINKLSNLKIEFQFYSDVFALFDLLYANHLNNFCLFCFWNLKSSEAFHPSSSRKINHSSWISVLIAKYAVTEL
jgi:hypothetical protein